MLYYYYGILQELVTDDCPSCGSMKELVNTPTYHLKDVGIAGIAFLETAKELALKEYDNSDSELLNKRGH